MPAKKNSYITNWLAAYCGDQQTIYEEALRGFEERSLLEGENGWPLIDTHSEKKRLLRSLIPKYSPLLTAMIYPERLPKTNTVRAIVEPVSGTQFCMRGYLVDLSVERKFALRVLEFQRDFALPQSSDEERADYPRTITDGDDATPAYAGIAYPKSRYFVGEINFSDFACFELNGFTTNIDEDDWRDGFFTDLQTIVDLISP